MNRLIISTVALSLLFCGALRGQTRGITVSKGSTFSYNVLSNGETTQSMGGDDKTTSSTSKRGIVLTALKKTGGTIEWSYKTSDEKAPAAASRKKPVKKEGGIERFMTDARGTILAIASGTPAPAEGDGTKMRLGSARSRYRMLFSPETAGSLKPGESWDEKVVDTTINPQLGMRVIATSTMHYTYEGTTDTLGMNAVRVRWSASDVSYDGTMTRGGMNMTIDGGGTTDGVSYFATGDGILLARLETIEAAVRVVVPQMVIPMTQKQQTTTVRERK